MSYRVFTPALFITSSADTDLTVVPIGTLLLGLAIPILPVAGLRRRSGVPPRRDRRDTDQHCADLRDPHRTIVLRAGNKKGGDTRLMASITGTQTILAIATLPVALMFVDHITGNG